MIDFLSLAYTVTDSSFLPHCSPPSTPRPRSTQYYKELEVNALGTIWNLMMVKPYIDGGPAVCNATVPGQCSPNAPADGVTETWDIASGVRVGVEVNGTLNDPVAGSHVWTVELCLPLAEYAKYEPGVNVPPKVIDVCVCVERGCGCGCGCTQG